MFFHPPRAGKRLFKLWRMVEDSAKPYFTTPPALDTLRETWDPPLSQPPLHLWPGESYLPSSPGHLLLGVQGI